MVRSRRRGSYFGGSDPPRNSKPERTGIRKHHWEAGSGIGEAANHHASGQRIVKVFDFQMLGLIERQTEFLTRRHHASMARYDSLPGTLADVAVGIQHPVSFGQRHRDFRNGDVTFACAPILYVVAGSNHDMVHGLPGRLTNVVARQHNRRADWFEAAEFALLFLGGTGEIAGRQHRPAEKIPRPVDGAPANAIRLAEALRRQPCRSWCEP
jgi:hypothetical protein